MAEKIIHAGIEDGSLAACDVDTTYHFFLGALQHLPVWFAGSGRSLDDVSDALVALVLRGIGSKSR
jgi:hypothetical protein